MCLLAITTVLFLLPGPLFPADQSVDLKTIKSLLIQEGGRVKPMDTFFTESLLLVTGKMRFQGRDSAELCLSWIVDPTKHEKEPFVAVTHEPLKKIIGLDFGQKYFTPFELAENKELKQFLQEIGSRQQKKEKLNQTEQEALRVYSKLDRFYGIAQGTLLKIVPFPRESSKAWISPVDLLPGHELGEGLDPQLRADFLTVFGTLVQTYKIKEKQAFENASRLLVVIQNRIAESAGISLKAYPVRQELVYNSLKPFQQAWKFYLLSFLIFLFSLAWKNPWLPRIAFLPFIAGVLIHTLGFVLRCWIAGRPPVSNMYESIIWVSWGVVFFAGILALVYRQKLYLMAATAISTIALITAASAPTVLNPHVTPLEPVLRSNYWLTIHVLTITLSYAAFALALGVGHYQLILFGWKNRDEVRLKAVSLFLYRTLQIGVLLLASGTILGGVWANDSWGRFWGWDPKEVWALIALIGYLAVLHGRHAGWLRDFGVAVGSVVAFLGVLMAWYGVNFVLGVGLHSYGFGGGGLPYLLAFVICDLLFVGGVAWRYLQASRSKGRLSIRLRAGSLTKSGDH